MNGAFYNTPTFPSATEEDNKVYKNLKELIKSNLGKNITVQTNTKEWNGVLKDVGEDYIILYNEQAKEKYSIKQEIINCIEEK